MAKLAPMLSMPQSKMEACLPGTNRWCSSSLSEYAKAAAMHSAAGLPAALLPAARAGIEQQSEDTVFGHMGQLAQHDVKQPECLPRQAPVGQSEPQREEPS